MKKAPAKMKKAPMKMAKKAPVKNKGLQKLAAANPELTYSPVQMKKAAMKMKKKK